MHQNLVIFTVGKKQLDWKKAKVSVYNRESKIYPQKNSKGKNRILQLILKILDVTFSSKHRFVNGINFLKSSKRMKDKMSLFRMCVCEHLHKS